MTTTRSTAASSTVGATTPSAAKSGRVKGKTLLFTGLAAAALGLLAFLVIDPGPGVEVITEGRFYKSGTLPHAELVDEVQERGIRTVIDFRETPADVKAEGEALAAVGVEHVSIPSSQVPSQEAVDAFLDVIDDDASYPILVHCRHGYGRAQVFSAIYRMEYEDWDNDRARRATRSPLRLPFSSFKEGEPKADFLLSYQPVSGDSAGPAKGESN